MAVSVFDGQEHSLAQVKKEREGEEAELGAHGPGCSLVGVVNLAGWPVPPRAAVLVASVPTGQCLNIRTGNCQSQRM